MSDDEIFSSRQTAKHTCMALRRYFEAHLAIKVEQVKQSLQRTEGGVAVHPQPYYKVRLSNTPQSMTSHGFTRFYRVFCNRTLQTKKLRRWVILGDLRSAFALIRQLEAPALIQGAVVFECLVGVFIHTRAGGGDGGVSGGVWTSAFVLGAWGGLSQTLLRSASPAAHFHRLRLENLLRQVSLDKRESAGCLVI